MAAGALVSALAGALVAVVMIEEAVEANHRRGVQALYAADGLLASVVASLSRASDWNTLPEGPGHVGFLAGPSVAALPDGSVVDADAETRALAAGRDRPGDPGWRLVARGWLGDLAGAADLAPRLYLLAWFRRAPAGPDAGPHPGPDPGPDAGPGPDADPPGDANGLLVVRAAAFGPFRVERAVEATLVREAAVVRVAAWNVVR